MCFLIQLWSYDCDIFNADCSLSRVNRVFRRQGVDAPIQFFEDGHIRFDLTCGSNTERSIAICFCSEEDKCPPIDTSCVKYSSAVYCAAVLLQRRWFLREIQLDFPKFVLSALVSKRIRMQKIAEKKKAERKSQGKNANIMVKGVKEPLAIAARAEELCNTFLENDSILKRVASFDAIHNCTPSLMSQLSSNLNSMKDVGSADGS